MRLQRLTRLAAQAGPVEPRRNLRVAVIRLLRVLVRQLQEQQVGELFEVIAIAHPVIAQGVAEVPDFLDKCGGVHGRKACAIDWTR